MGEIFTQIGGARLGMWNATLPFATLSARADELRLSCFGRNYVFPRNKILKLSRHRGIFSLGMRIEHEEPSIPEFVVFWASAFFWTAGFQKLKTGLEGLGYEVQD
jgi:hypothetical protein